MNSIGHTPASPSECKWVFSESIAGTVTLAQCVALLEARRQIVCDAINECARPTAACDADFNALLAERAAIVLALAHLRPLCRGEVRIAHPRDDR